MNKRLHAEVHGRVQGVGFRMFVWRQAQALGLHGAVRNLYLPRRLVEVTAEGPEEALARLLELLHQGPLGSRVDRVEATWATATDEFDAFSIR
ncbi:MAG: acylphosphatase [Caldilineales bacterium]|nr:acylphosphatase [Caldilineales bacterium]